MVEAAKEGTQFGGAEVEDDLESLASYLDDDVSVMTAFQGADGAPRFGYVPADSRPFKLNYSNITTSGTMSALAKHGIDGAQVKAYRAIFVQEAKSTGTTKTDTGAKKLYGSLMAAYAGFLEQTGQKISISNFRKFCEFPSE